MLTWCEVQFTRDTFYFNTSEPVISYFYMSKDCVDFWHFDIGDLLNEDVSTERDEPRWGFFIKLWKRWRVTAWKTYDYTPPSESIPFSLPFTEKNRNKIKWAVDHQNCSSLFANKYSL